MNPRHHVGWLVVALIALVAPAAGAATGGGILTQFPVPGGCYAELAASGCQDSNHLVHATGVVVSPDGRTAYVASPDSDSVTGYSLDPATGAITGRIACWSKAVATPTCNQGSGLDGARGLALAPDGKTLYVASASHSSTSGSIAALARDPATGALPSQRNCKSSPAAGGCVFAAGLEGAQSVAVAPHGQGLYVAAYYGGPTGGALTAFNRLADGTIGGEISCRTGTIGGAAGCTEEPLALHPVGLAVAPDEKTVFVTLRSLGGAVAGWTRSSLDGSLGSNASTCRSQLGDIGCNQTDGLADARTVTLNATGSRVYVTGADGGGSAVALTRDPSTGALGTSLGCVAAEPLDGCARTHAMTDANGIALSPDGLSLYVASAPGIAVFATRGDGGFANEVQCVTETVNADCVRGTGVSGGSGVAVRSDNRTVLTAARSTGASGDLAAFRREIAPVCASASQRVVAGSPNKVRLTCTDGNGDTLTHFLSLPAHGVLSSYDSPAQTVAYTPEARFHGADAVQLTAADGAAESTPVNLSFTVVGDHPPSSRIRTLTRRRFTGTASDDVAVRRVEVAVVAAGAGCRELNARGALGRRPARHGRCRSLIWLKASGSAQWAFRPRRALARGTYTVYSRATDSRGRHEARFSRSLHNRAALKVR